MTLVRDKQPSTERRRSAIVALLREAGQLTTADIADRLGVSRMTVRRDFAELERAGVGRKTHGGLVAPGAEPPPAAEEPDARTVRAASAIVAGIADGSAIFLDSSPVGLCVAQALIANHRTLTVITNSLPIMLAISLDTDPRLRLVGICGDLNRRTRSYVGPGAVAMAREHFADCAYLGGGVEDALDADVKRVMLEQACEGVLAIPAAGVDEALAAVLAPHDARAWRTRRRDLSLRLA